MGHTSSTFTLPIGVLPDLAYFFGIGSGDIGTIIANAPINPWAMFKPVRSSSPGTVERPDLTNDAPIANLGLGNASGVAGPPYATTVQGLLDFYGDTATIWNGAPANGWRYLRPRGAANSEYYRIYDFLRIAHGAQISGTGYAHDASNPFGSNWTCPSSIYRNGGSLTAAQIKPIPQADIDVSNIVIGSFNNKLASGSKMLYYGVLLAPPSGSGSAYKLIVSANTIENGDYRGDEELRLEAFTITTSVFSVGEYTAYPILTNRDITGRISSIDSASTSLGRMLFPIPGMTPKTINIYDYLMAFTITATTVMAQLKTNVNIIIKNNYEESKTINDLTLKMRRVSAAWDTARQTGEIFFTKDTRYDDANPSGTPDSTYAAMLQDRTLTAGQTIYIPNPGETTQVTLPIDSNIAKLFIGCSLGNGYVDLIMPN